MISFSTSKTSKHDLQRLTHFFKYEALEMAFAGVRILKANDRQKADPSKVFLLELNYHHKSKTAMVVIPGTHLTLLDYFDFLCCSLNLTIELLNHEIYF
jgi:hypothetical protein